MRARRVFAVAALCVHAAGAARDARLRRGVWLKEGHEQVFGAKRGERYTAARNGISPLLIKLVNAAAAGERDVYQFGVYTGGGLAKIAKHLTNYRRLWGFDSFQGIPAEAAEEQANHWTPHFRPGGYSAADALGEYSLAKLTERVGATVRRANPRVNLTFVPGYFNESLTPALLRRLRPALYVDVDVDIYLSTVQCLGWMLANKLIVPGTFVRYDDWVRRAPCPASPCLALPCLA